MRRNASIQRDVSIGRKTATAALACVLSVSMVPTTAFAADAGASAAGSAQTQEAKATAANSAGSATSAKQSSASVGSAKQSTDAIALAKQSTDAVKGADDSAEGSGAAAGKLVVQAGDTGSAASSTNGSSTDGNDSGNEGGSNSGEATGGKSDGQGGAGTGGSESGGQDGSQTGGSGTEGGTGEGSGASGGSGSGEGSGTGAGEGSGTSGSTDEGTGTGSGEGSQTGDEDGQKEAVVLDLAAATTKVTVADVTVGTTPVVKATFAGSTAVRDLSQDAAFKLSFFGPDGSKATAFTEPGRYSVKVSAASANAKTSAGEVVTGKTGLILFEVKDKKQETAQQQTSASSAEDEKQAAGSSDSASKSGTSASGGGKASTSSSSSSSTPASSGSADKSASSSAAGSASSSSADSETGSGASSATDATATTATASTTSTTTVVRRSGGSYSGSANGRVTYLGAVTLGSSSGTVQPGAVQLGAVQPGAVGAVVAGSTAELAAQAQESAYALDDAATDVSALVSNAAGGTLLFWGGGTEVAPQYIWSVDTQALTRDDAFGLDLKAAAAQDSDPVMAGADGADATGFVVQQAGALPAGCTMYWRTSSVFFDGEALDVYHYDAATGDYELVESGVAADGGYVRCTPEQGGAYLVVESGKGPGSAPDAPASVPELLKPAEAYAAEPAADVSADGSDADADDAWAVPAALAAAIAAVGGVWATMRRKLAGVASVSAPSGQKK